MEMKNKLYKHHKSKSYFILRNLGVSVASIGALFAIVSLPTYISIKTQVDAPTSAMTENEEKNDDVVEAEIVEEEVTENF